MTDMAVAWRERCRLCFKGGAEENINVFLQIEAPAGSDESTLSAKIKRYFDVHITKDDTLPKIICTDCYLLISSLVNYATYVVKVQKMYQTVEEAMDADNPLDFEELLQQFDVLSEQRPQLFIQYPKTKVEFVDTNHEVEDLAVNTSEVEIKSRTNTLDTALLDEINVETSFTQTESATQIIKNTTSLEQFFGEDKRERVIEYTCVNLNDGETNTSGVRIENAANALDTALLDNRNIETGLNQTVWAAQLIKSNTSLGQFFAGDKSSHEIKDTCADLNDEEANTSVVKIECATNTLDTGLLDDINIEIGLKQTESAAQIIKGATSLEKSLNESTTVEQIVTANNHHKQDEQCILRKHVLDGTSRGESADDSIKTCPMCEKTVKKLHLHMKRVHAVPEHDLLQKCDQCPRSFATENKLRNHMQQHVPLEIRNTLPCQHCTSKFSTKNLLRLHVSRMHMGTQHFICEECGISVRTKASLKVHMLIHSDHMPFQCDLCQKAFRHKCALKVHMDTHDPNKHICGVCGTALNTKLMLKRHMLVHSDVLQHKCDFCGRGFKRSKTLKNHLLAHTGLRPYGCEFCERTFTTGPNCRAHKKRKHSDELAAWEEAGGYETHPAKVPKLRDLIELTKAAKDSAKFATSCQKKDLLELKKSKRTKKKEKSSDESIIA